MIRKHVGEKPHSCKQYNYMSTTFSDALQIHMMTHKQWQEALQVTSVIALTHKHISVYLCFWVDFLKPKTSYKNIVLFA